MDADAIPGALNSVRQVLAGAAGVNTSVDPAALVPPGIWVVAREIPEDAWTLAGPAYVNAYLYLIAGDVGTPEAHDILGAMLAKVLTVVTPDGPINTAMAITLADNPTPLPAYLVPVRLDL